MSTEISTEHADEAPSPTNTLAMIARAASDPAVSVEKMVELNNLHERIMDRAAREAYTAAFAAAMMEMPSITKNGAIKNNSGQVQSRYAKWEDLDRVIRPILKRNGLVLSFELSEAPGKALAVCAVLSHVGGHQERSGPMPMPVDSTGAKNAVQGTGSAMSYGKRYATIAMLNIITEDEDTDGRPPHQAKADDADQAQKLIYSEAKMAAENGGSIGYENHFKGLTRAAKLFLTSTTGGSGKSLHDELKELASRPPQRAGARA